MEGALPFFGVAMAVTDDSFRSPKKTAKMKPVPRGATLGDFMKQTHVKNRFTQLDDSRNDPAHKKGTKSEKRNLLDKYEGPHGWFKTFYADFTELPASSRRTWRISGASISSATSPNHRVAWWA